MAQAVETIIDIGGRQIKDFTSLKLSQGIYAHHAFRLECFAEALGENMRAVFNESADLIGAPVQIQVRSVAEPSRLSFSGFITQVAAGTSNGHPGTVVISGASPTILLDQGSQIRCWDRKTVKNIIEEVLAPFYADWLKYKFNAVYDDTIHYEVQYNETAWQFISRLAGRYGEWLYYDGQKLVIGAPREPAIQLEYGVQLSRFEQGIELKPGKLQARGRNYVEDEEFDSLIENMATHTGHLDVGAKVLAKGEQLLGAQETYWHPHNIKKKDQLEKVMTLRAAVQNSDIIRMTGSSDVPGLRPGDAISIKKEEIVNSYRLISIDHSWDGTGNYTNDFVAIPASVKKAPAKLVKPPYCPTQPAIVVENYDDSDLGRVKVKFSWMKAGQKSPCIRMVSPYTGNGNGLYMIPEIGSEVLVAFVDGNATSPYVIGVVNNGNAKAMYGNKENSIKAIHTRSGIRIIMDDQAGSLLIQDKNGNKLEMDGQGAIRINAQEALELSSGQSIIAIKNDGTIKISGRVVEIDAGEEVRIVSDDVKISAAEKVAVKGARITLN
jgi:type VI secretion system secreted protein VgrG